LEAAEMSKLLENTFRAVNISLANEFADVAHHLDLDPIEVIEAAATKPYGFMPFYPGPGVGGHCIPCDPHYLLWQLRRDHVHPALISSAMESISTRPLRIVERAAQVLEGADKTLRNSRVLVAGVAYKPDVADTRESPAVQVIEGLARRGASVDIYDPLVHSVDVGQRVYLSLTDEAVSQGFDLVVLCCRHTSMNERLFACDTPVLDATYTLRAAERIAVP
jgi:nucleotide sugar dehydrogenase